MKTPRLLALALCAGLASPSLAQQIHYVRAGATGSGISWADAFGSLQDALSAAGTGDQVWVAAGTYRPDEGISFSPGDRGLSFVVEGGVRVHGGFSGTEASLGERDLAANRTVLSGDLASDDYTISLNAENSLHVVRFAAGADDALLEGVTVAGGNADGAGADSLGGGILVEGGAPWIVNTHVNGSLAGCGGGIAVVGGASATLVNVAVHGNRAGSGGGICSLGSSVSVANGTVTANAAIAAPGILNRDGDVSITNSIVSGNRRLGEMDHCEARQYPCSLADVSEEALAKGLAVMQGAWTARDAGTMLDALAWLDSHPDVVQALGDSTMVLARVRGGTFDVLVEAPEGLEVAGKAGPGAGAAEDRAPFLASADAGERFMASGHRNIVGEDRNGDGRIDNRDGKRALVIAPFRSADAAAAALILEQTRDYEGRVSVVAGNAISDYSSWEAFDFVYLSTRAMPVGLEVRSAADVLTVIETALGIPESPDVAESEHGFRTWLYENGGFLPDLVNGRMSLSPRYFRLTYDGSLSNTIVVCAGCDVQTGKWSQTLGIENFSLLGWSGQVDLADAGPKAAEIVGRMATGLEANDARQSGDIPVYSGRQVFSADHFSQLHRRIIDLPLVLYPGSSTVLRDGMDITKAVVGTVGDDVADSLAVDLVMQGVHDSQTQSEDYGFWVHYVVKDVDNGYEYSLGGAVPLGANAYLVQHRIPLGFPVQKGLLPIEVVAKVPVIGLEISESRFSVNATVDAFPCSATATVSGFRDAAFTGPAGFFYTENPPGWWLEMQSLEWTIGLDPDGDGAIRGAFSASVLVSPDSSFFDGASTDIPNDTYSLIQSYDLRDIWGFLTAHYTDTCVDCGGRITIDSLNTEKTLVYGSIEFTGMEGTDEDPKPSTLKATFKAAMGDYTGEETPYTKCVEAYWQLD